MYGLKLSLVTLLAGWVLALSKGHVATPGRVKIGLKKISRKQGDLPIERLNRGLSLINDQDDAYYGEILVGTPPQKAMVDFDTGSSDMFVSSFKMCANPDYQTYCETNNVYDSKKSKTYEEVGKNYTLFYGSLTVSGFSSRDSFEINGLKATGQQFLEIMYFNGTWGGLGDGLIGLGYPALTDLPADPAFVTMVKQGLLDHAVFSFYLNDKNQREGHDAELVMGGTDPDRYTGDIIYTPVIDKGYWQVEFHNVSFGSQQLVKSISAIIDSGTTLLYGPTELVDTINNKIGGEMQKNGTFKVDCAKKEKGDMPEFAFTINGKQLKITAKDYIFEEENYCISAFIGGFPEGLLMGDVLMRRYYTVFDMEKDRVGFALAK